MKSTIEIKVRGYHEDHFKHVNHARYIEFLEEGRWAYYDDNSLIENLFYKIGVFHAVINININYRKAASAGDTLRIETDVEKYSRSQIVISQKIYLKDKDILVASAEVTNIFIDTTTGKIRPIDNEILNLWADLNKTIPQ